MGWDISMNKKMRIKMTVDILMTIVLFISMSFQFIGRDNHEISGATMLILFILHHLLNINWYKNLLKGKYTAAHILQTIVDFALFMVMMMQMVSGIAMSRYVFTFIELGMSVSTARSLHMMFAYTGFLLMSFHIGLHYGIIMNMFGRLTGVKRKNNVRTIIIRFIAALIAGYGVYALEKRGVIANILRLNEFAFFDYEESVIFYIIDYFAVMVLMIFIAYYLQKMILKHNKKRERSE